MKPGLPIHFAAPGCVLFGWYHAPRTHSEGKHRGMGVILCNTLGNESLRVHRSLRVEAEHLADAGFAVLRFDFRGTGDSLDTDGSSAQVHHEDLVQAWLKNIESAVQEIQRLSGIKKISMIGVRLGATLAAQSASLLGRVDSLVLWEPLMSGKDFIKETGRQHKMLISLSPSGFTLDHPGGVQGGKEFLGFFVNDLTLKSLETLDLLTLNKSPARNTLLVGTAGAPSYQKLSDHLAGLGSKVDYQQVAGYQGIFREALLSEVPFAALNAIKDWLCEKCDWVSDALPPLTPSSPNIVLQKSFEEEPVFFGDRQALFGILTFPTTKKTLSEKTGVIIVNAGVGTHIGPHRLYVQMARDWSQKGFYVFRTDLAGSGESAGAAFNADGSRDGKEESSPYPLTAVSDVKAAMNYLEKTEAIKRFIVVGTCSGADISFRSATQDSRIAGAVVVNPRTFCLYNFPELETHIRAHHLQRNLTRGKNWIKLLKGGSGTFNRISSVANSVAFKAKELVKKGIQPLQVPFQKSDVSALNDERSWPVRDIPDRINDILRRGSKLFLVVSDGDPGVEYVDIHFPKQMKNFHSHAGYRRLNLNGADHLFTLQYAREKVLDAITEYLVSSFE